MMKGKPCDYFLLIVEVQFFKYIFAFDRYLPTVFILLSGTTIRMMAHYVDISRSKSREIFHTFMYGSSFFVITSLRELLRNSEHGIKTDPSQCYKT